MTLTEAIEETTLVSENAQEASPQDQESGKKSLRGAINQACYDCIYDSESGEGNWRQQVEKCTVSKCGLYHVRPISKPKKAQELPPE